MDNKKTGKSGSSRQTAAELYEVQPYYERYNQKYNMTRRGQWEEAEREIGKKRINNLEKRVLSGINGYTTLDWAFFKGAHTNVENTGFNVNRPNMFGNSWEPISRHSRAGRYPAPDLSLERWQGSPEDASRILKKMSVDYYGADMAGFCLLDRRWVYSHWFDEENKKDYPIKFSDEPGYESYTVPTQLEDKTQVIPKEMKYVVALIFEMDKDAIAAAPTVTQMAGTRLAYSRISFTTASVAEFIRGMGYNAIPSANCTALSIPLAVDAGLGAAGQECQAYQSCFWSAVSHLEGYHRPASGGGQAD
ncbi:reductive dehalogenase domain-containing protein [Chloroflexota bacterium]